MRNRTLLWFITVVTAILWSVPGGHAQESTCPALIDEAVKLTNAVCEPTGRNQACYGNLHLSAEPRPGAVDFAFAEPGDIEDVIDIAALKLDPFDPESRVWGVTLMKLQANLPDTLPGQNVTVLLFGDVEITNAVDEPALTLTVAASNNINVRGGPGTTYDVVSGLQSGDAVSADGRTEDNSWLRVQLPDGRMGWAFAELVTPDGDIETLPVRAADDNTPALRPMQAFYFRSGVGSAACAGVVDSGLLIQTPKGVGEVTLSVNEVRIRLGSTVFLQTNDASELVIAVIEGQAHVEAQGVEQTVQAGEQVSVPLDDNLAASGPPSAPQPIPDASVQTLPFALLPETVAPPLPEETPSAEATSEARPGGPPGATGAVTISVPGNADWVDSGVQISAGQTFTISASGAVNPCVNNAATNPICVDYGPEGGAGPVASSPPAIFPLPGAPLAALVGRIDGGAPFLVGKGGTFVADSSGTLQFHVNDDQPRNNSGAFTVTIVVQ